MNSLDISEWFPDESSSEGSVVKKWQNTKNKTFPVNIVSLNVGWLINKEEGYEFLCAIDENQQMELYGVKTIEMIIELLYYKFKEKIFWPKIALYTLEMVLIHIMVWITEVIHYDGGDALHSFILFEKPTREILEHNVRPVLTVFNVLLVLYQFYEQILYWKSLRQRLFISVRFWIDLVYLMICLILMKNLVTE